MVPAFMDPVASRRREMLASNTLFFGLAVALADSGRTMRGTLHKPATLGTLLVGSVLLGGFYCAIRRGVTLLKWPFVLGQGATLVHTLVQHRTTLLPALHSSRWTAFSYVAFFGPRLVAMLGLLPTLRTRRPAPSINAWLGVQRKSGLRRLPGILIEVLEGLQGGLASSDPFHDDGLVFRKF